MLIKAIHHNLNELAALLRQLSNEHYSQPFAILSHATIGEHTRHIIEMFQCLQESRNSGSINYDNRRRDTLLESDPNAAIVAIADIVQKLEQQNRSVLIEQLVDDLNIEIPSNYYRELLYNHEHCIHHQALIKVAVLQLEHIRVSPDFGVARSTIQYRNQCAQ